MLVNRVGDFSLLLAIFAIYFVFNSLDYDTVFSLTPLMLDHKILIGSIEIPAIDMICILLFLGAMGCGVCGAFPFLAGKTTTVTNMGIIYTSSPIFIILISSFFFHEKINFTKIIGLISCLIGVFAIIIKGCWY